jgi:hypothetical protein
MPDKRGHQPQSLPVENYSPAIAKAVEWLGDRYLLAKPINKAGHGNESERKSVTSIAIAEVCGSLGALRGELSIPRSG